MRPPPCRYWTSRPAVAKRAKRRIEMFSPIFCTSACRTRLDRPAVAAAAPTAPRRRPDPARRPAAPACAANATKSSLRETKSVSQLTSTIAPACRRRRRYAPTTPSAATRPAALDALAPLLMRSSSSALARSPAVSASAFLHSIMPSPVRWRSSITMLAEMSAIADSVTLPVAPRARGPRAPSVNPYRARAPAHGGSRSRCAKAPGLRRVASSATSTNSSPACTISWMTVAPALEDRVGGAARVEADRPARIVVARDHVGDADRRVVGVDDARRSGCRASSPR